MRVQTGADRKIIVIARLLHLLDHAEQTNRVALIPHIEQAIRNVANT